MPKLSVNFSKTSFDTMPEGIYLCVVDFAQYIPESQSGYPYLKWQFTVAEEEFKGRKLWHNTSLQESASFALSSLLIALGYEPDETQHIEIEVSDPDPSGKIPQVLLYPEVVNKPLFIKVGFEPKGTVIKNKKTGAEYVVKEDRNVVLGFVTNSTPGTAADNGQQPLFT